MGVANVCETVEFKEMLDITVRIFWSHDTSRSPQLGGVEDDLSMFYSRTILSTLDMPHSKQG